MPRPAKKLLSASETPIELEGIVVRASGGHYYVETPQGVVDCVVPGRLKKEQREEDLVAVGDRVRLRLAPRGTGVIEEVYPRHSALVRTHPRASPPMAQVLVANPDLAVFVFAVRDPVPRLPMLDRLLVVAEFNEVPALICANKIDLLDDDEDPRDIFGLYEEIGYPVLYTSAVTGEGVDELRERLQDKLSVLAGPSGVGKTSLLNVMQPGLGLTVRRISRATRKGRHATVLPVLVRLDTGGYVADTPGLRALVPWDLRPEELDACFPEFHPYVPECRFPGCSHIHEPGCAVQAAVERGEIALSRYESYCRIYEHLGEKDWWE